MAPNFATSGVAASALMPLNTFAHMSSTPNVFSSKFHSSEK
jgi:hypothetical protein